MIVTCACIKFLILSPVNLVLCQLYYFIVSLTKRTKERYNGGIFPVPQESHVFKTHRNDQISLIGQVIYSQQEVREYHLNITFQEVEYKLNQCEMWKNQVRRIRNLPENECWDSG